MLKITVTILAYRIPNICMHAITSTMQKFQAIIKQHPIFSHSLKDPPLPPLLWTQVLIKLLSVCIQFMLGYTAQFTKELQIIK